MDKSSKKPWWDKKWGKDKICSITQTRLRPYNNTTKLSCGHIFITQAINIWFEKKDSCPICRKNIIYNK